MGWGESLSQPAWSGRRGRTSGPENETKTQDKCGEISECHSNSVIMHPLANMLRRDSGMFDLSFVLNLQSGHQFCANPVKSELSIEEAVHIC